jgi:hypothetical protein
VEVVEQYTDTGISGAKGRRSPNRGFSSSKLRQLGDIGRDPPRLIFGEQLGSGLPTP